MKILGGYTGLVGSNLLKQGSFELCINSQNVNAMSGVEGDLLVWAGVKAEKWRANHDPEGDKAHVMQVAAALRKVKAKRAVLISTIDVYPNPRNVDEDSPIHSDSNHAYGKHRLWFESFFIEHFPCSHVVRLPGLFGDGLKKNVIFDFFHRNELTKLHPDSQFQFYCLDRLMRDVQKVIGLNIPLLNIVSEPVSVREVAQVAFGLPFENDPGRAPVAYAVNSKFAEAWGGRNGYLYTSSQVLSELKNFVERSQKRGHL